MLDGILGRGFSSKCKSLIKPTRTRIDVLRKRKEATQRFLKNNLAQLLVNGHDMDAYGRTEEYLAEGNLLSCYDFIEQSCLYILKQLSVMQKQSECPEECREAVGSLMFAAARFSDFPELRDLRDTFQERYDSGLEHFVNQKFVENLASRPSTVEKKIKLLQDIALEISINWDSNSFEQRIVNPSASAQGQPKYGPIHDHCDKFKSPKDKETIKKIDKRREESSKERNGVTSYEHGEHISVEGNLFKRGSIRREELTGKSRKPSEQTTPNRKNYDIAPLPTREPIHGNQEDSAAKSIGKRAEFVDRAESANNYGQSHLANSTNKAQGEERETLKPCLSNVPPPPYIKSRDKLIAPPYIKSEDGRHGVDGESSMEPSTHKGDNGREESSGPKYEKDLSYQNHISLPKQRSGRKSQRLSSSGNGVGNSVEEDRVVKGSSSSRRKDTSKTGLRVLIDDRYHRNEEEMAIDRLLFHYSKKPSTYEPEKARRRKSKKDPGRPNNAEDEIDRPPTRSVSLPRGQIASAEATIIGYTRANSFQPDNPAGHVHPKLPDCDDLAARIDALRGW